LYYSYLTSFVQDCDAGGWLAEYLAGNCESLLLLLTYILNVSSQLGVNHSRLGKTPIPSIRPQISLSHKSFSS
jgi:hypothetical protein